MASSPSMVKTISSRKSFLFCKSPSSIFVPNALASFTTSSGNLYGSSYCLINESISTPASLIPPRTSIILPSAFFPFSGYFVICTKTL